MTLALIAGRGRLPAQVAAAQARPPFVCALAGNGPDTDLPVDVTFRLETLGSLMADLVDRGVTEVCFCGGVDRPAFDPEALDAATLPLVPLFQRAMASGDNGALEVIKQIFEQKGFAVRGADELVAGLVARAGVLSRAQPSDQMRRDAARGASVLAGLAALDIGQACVIGHEQVLGVEAMGGTAHLLETLPSRAREMNAILCKGPKSGQIREIDMPTIGPETFHAAHTAGLAGIVVDAGEVIILERDICVRLADQHGLVLWSREAEVE